MEIPQELIGIVLSGVTIALGYLARRYKNQWDLGMQKADEYLFAFNKVKEAAQDKKITEDEFQGIVKAFNSAINKE